MANIMTGMMFAGRSKTSENHLSIEAAQPDAVYAQLLRFKRAYEDNSQSPMWAYLFFTFAFLNSLCRIKIV